MLTAKNRCKKKQSCKVNNSLYFKVYEDVRKSPFIERIFGVVSKWACFAVLQNARNSNLNTWKGVCLIWQKEGNEEAK